jgi:hypothetical protein
VATLVTLRDDQGVTQPGSDGQDDRDRAAVEYIKGASLPRVWLAGALVPGTQVRVIELADGGLHLTTPRWVQPFPDRLPRV